MTVTDATRGEDRSSAPVVPWAGFEVVAHRQTGGRVLLQLHGELDAATAPVLADQLGRFADVHLDVDLQHLSFIDSSGAITLCDAARALAPGNEVVITSPSPIAVKIFDLVVRPSTMRVERGEASAVARPSRQRTSPAGRLTPLGHRT